MPVCPFAIQKSISGTVGAYKGGPYKIVHHTTEGPTVQGAFDAYKTHKSDPHFTLDHVTIYQHIDTGTAARSLENLGGGVETNRDSAVQIEVVGYAGRPKGKWTLLNLARLCRWLEKEHSIPKVWPNGFPKSPKNGKDPGGHNRDAKTWDSKGGHYGHSHVPENTHWDPAYTQAEVDLVMAAEFDEKGKLLNPEHPAIAGFDAKFADEGDIALAGESDANFAVIEDHHRLGADDSPEEDPLIAAITDEMVAEALAAGSDVADAEEDWRDLISQRGYDFIVRWETGGRAYYDNHIKGKPIWPGYSSGVTIGCGYDLGYHSLAEFRAEWGGRIPEAQIARLAAAIGLRSVEPDRDGKIKKIKALIGGMSDIVIPWDVAIGQFDSAKMPKLVTQLYTHLDNVKALHPHCRGALLSLVFNRGPSFAKEGDRYREMRAIGAAMRAGPSRFGEIPGHLRDMKRIWGANSSLATRREGEAELFERGLAGTLNERERPVHKELTTEVVSPCLLLTAKGEFAEGGEKAFEALAARLKVQEQPKLLLFVHGGLVPRAVAKGNAERLDHEVVGWGKLKAEGWETAYLIWQSGLAETIRLHRDELAHDDLFTRIILEVAAWTGGRAGLGAEIAATEDPEAVIRALEATPPPSPEVLGAELDARGERVKAELVDSLTDAALLDTDLAGRLAAEPRFRALAATLDDRVAEMPETRHLDEEVRLEMRAARELAQAGHTRGGARLSGVELVLILRIVGAGFRVLNRLLRKRDYGLGCTIVEEVIRARSRIATSSQRVAAAAANRSRSIRPPAAT